MKNVFLSRLASLGLASLLLLGLAACGGGGGDAGTPAFGSGGKAPTLTLALSSSKVTANTPVGVTATVRDGNGQPVSGIVVTFALSRPELTELNAITALTDAQGEAKVTLSASSSGLTGADELTASANVNATAVQNRAGFSVDGALPTVSVRADSTTLSGSRGPVRVTAELRDAAGKLLPGQIVTFASAGGKVRLSQVSALTDAQGVATTTALPQDPTVAAADTVVASATVAGREVQSPINLQIVAEPASPARLPSLTVALSSPELTAITPTVVTVTVRDASSLPVPGVVVRLSTTRVDLASLSTTSVLTDAQGVGRLTISPINSGVTGADDLNATTTLGTTALTARVGFSVPGATASINASIDSTTIRGSTGPVRFTAQVRNAAGVAVAGQVVSFASPAGLLRLSPTSALTDATGVATTSVSPVDPTVGLAETIVATTSIDGRTLQSQVNVQVIGEAAVAPRSATLVLAVSASEVTAAAPATVTATVRDAAGLPVAGVVVGLSTSRGNLGQLSTGSVLTDANGQARVTLAVAAGGLTGADDLLGTATVGAATLQARVGFNVTGAVPTLQALVDSTTLRASVGPVRFTAVARNAQGQPVVGQLVTFGSTTGAVRISPASALTDATGTAATTVQPADAASGLADTLVASAAVSGRTVQGSVGVQVIAEEPSIALTVTPSQNIGTASPATVQAVVRDASGALVPNAVVSFSTQSGLGSFSASTAATAAVTGTATSVLRPVAATTAGADVVRASVTVAGVTRTTQQTVQFVPAAAPVTPSIVLSLSSSTVTPQLPASVSLRVLDGLQRPVAGAVVTLATGRANLGVLSATSVLTDTQGRATASLASAGSGLAGADELIATATVEGSRVQSTAGFDVSAAAPTLQLTLSPDTGLRTSTSPPATLTATVRDAAGIPQAGQLVRFEGVNRLVRLSAPSAVTNGSGVAVVTVVPDSPQNAGAELLRAAVTLSGRDLQASKNVDVVRESPAIELSFTGSSTATLAAPAGVRAVVRDLRGNLVPGTIVRFSTQGGLGAFNVASVATAADGSANAFVSPATSATTGADTVVASATIDGVAISATQVAQFVPTGAGTASLRLSLSSTSISSGSPATVTATLTDSRGTPVAGQVVTFEVVRGLARTSVGTSLTDAVGVATVVLAPTSPTGAGADEVTASVTLGGTTLTDTQGFQINATNVTLAFDALPDPFTLAEYGQTPLTLRLVGAGIGAPVNVAITSSCAALGKAAISPANFTATTASVPILYRDTGCGELQSADQIQAVVVGSANSSALSMPLSRPGVSSLAFVQAVPDQIFLKGSGLGESSTVTFEVRDVAGNPIRNQNVQLTLLSGAGGVTLDGRPVGVPGTSPSDASGRVVARVNSGTLPTPVRVQASITLPSGAVVSTVSSNLSVGVGLPAQLNFSLTQGTRNIEGYNIDNEPNTYSIIASDRNGNPVPVGTTVNFVTEGGSIQASQQVQLVNGLARATANFVSSEPRPVDGRVTITAYALGEESFIDLNGNNTFDSGEPFQDLGNVFKDRNFDGLYDPGSDEFVPLGVNDGSACVVSGNALLDLDPSIPSIPNSCSGTWSGAGRVYVRRALETVLSTSAARPLWASVAGLEEPATPGAPGCRKIRLQTGPQPFGAGSAPSALRAFVAGDTWYSTATEGVLSFIVADANPGRPTATPPILPRLNPMAAGSTIIARSPTAGFSVAVAGGSPVPSTTEATLAVVSYNFTDPAVQSGVANITFASPRGTATTYSITVNRTRGPLSNCVVDP